MKKNSVYVIALLALVFCFSLTCSPEGTSKVTITIDLGTHNKSASNAPESSIIDRVLRFFAKNTEAAPPSHINSITLNISGDGMDTITKSYASPSIPDTITLEIPAGDSRTFELLAYTASATLRGVATRNLTSGATVTIPIQMGLYETKIVLPDYNNNRIVQIDDLSLPLTAPNWKEASITYPYDIDFSSDGKIYIAIRQFGTDGARIVRLDDITASASTLTALNKLDGYIALCIDRRDRNNNLIYYATEYQIYRANLDGTNEFTSYNMTNIGTVRGLNITSTGLLLIAHNNASLGQEFSIYDPAGTGTIINTLSYNLGGSDPRTWDLAEINSRIYGALHDIYNDPIIFIREFYINASNQLIEEGSIYTNQLYGPHKFINTHSNKIYFLNDGSTLNSLSVIDDITGTGRQDYGSTGSGVGNFNFYN